ncbi:MAG TPA: hypothetical protein VFN10_21135 [Thermoanaerobaculia bacterium]|nr:hypothetical protein [Thermoanaerobaculia bacterium]
MPVTRGFLLRLDAKAGKEAEVEEFLVSSLALARQELGTVEWFAVRFGRGEYGIFDVFNDDAGREAHATGEIAKILRTRGPELLDKVKLEKLDILAEKLPVGVIEPVTKVLLLTFRAKSGHEGDVETFLRDAKPLVEAEPKTIAWFAFHSEEGEYGIFDVFPDAHGRFMHLTGQVPRELAKHALTLLGSIPDTHLPEVLAAKLA